MVPAFGHSGSAPGSGLGAVHIILYLPHTCKPGRMSGQRRYLRARETLARVRRQLHATLQVHIAPQGGQQVNVSGDIRLDRDGE